MKRILSRAFAAPGDCAGLALLALYGCALLVADPAWILWAGPVTMGAFPVDAAPVAAAPGYLDTLQAASCAAAAGLLAVAAIGPLWGAAEQGRRTRRIRGLLHGHGHAGP